MTVFKTDWAAGNTGHIAAHNAIGARLNGAFNVLDYGAAGDGETDDSAAFASALAAGDVIVAPAGYTFLVGDVVVSGKTIAGDGTIKKKSASECAFHMQATGSVVRGLTFAGQSTSGQPNTDIKLGDGASNVVIADNWFKSPTYSAIAAAIDIAGAGGTAYSTRVSGVQITGNRFTSGAGNYVRPLFLHSVDNIVIANNLIRDTNFDAIRLRENDGYCTIVGNVFVNIGDPTWPDAQTRDAVDTYWAGQRLTIANNVVRTTACIGFDIKLASPDGAQRSQMVIIEGNQVSGTRFAGIQLGGDPDYDGGGSYKSLVGGIVANNVVEDCNQSNAAGGSGIGDAGIYLIGLVAHTAITGNFVGFNYGRGVSVVNNTADKAAVHDIQIGDNICLNNGYTGTASAGIHVAGASNIAIHDNICINDDTEANNVQYYGIYVSSAADGLGYTPTAKSITIRGNICRNNTNYQILTDANNSRADAIAVYADNVEEGTNANYRGSWQGQRSILFGADVPAVGDGTFRQGDIIFNTGATAAGQAGWVCVTAGAPGTWKTFGVIAE